jgi:transmembrane sensor
LNRATPPDDDRLLDEALTLVVRMHSGEPGNSSRTDLECWERQSAHHARAASEAQALWSQTGELRLMPGDAGGGLGRRVFVLGGITLLGAGGWAWRRQMVAGRFSTGTSSTRVIDLADGSRIELSARSGIDLDDRLPRRAELRAGQAVFDIFPDASPYRILAGPIGIEANQGLFDIDMRGRDGSAILSLGSFPARTIPQPFSMAADTGPLEGFGRGDGGKLGTGVSATGQILAAESVYRFVPGQKPQRLDQRAEDAFAWRKGKLIAEDISLGRVINTLNAWHSGWIVILDDGVAELPVTAVLDLHRPAESLRSLERGLPIRVRSLGGVVVGISWA